MVNGNEVAQAEGKLKLIHIVYVMIAAVLIVGIAIGGIVNQQKTNTKSIDKKVEKEMYTEHVRIQEQQFETIQQTLVRIEQKIP